MPRTTDTRVGFTDEHDVYLARYLARYSPTKENRSGNALYKDLVANEENKWPWSVHHTWQSWRQRYVKNYVFFDVRIAKYQAKSATVQKRKSPAGSASTDTPPPRAKRVKLEAEKGRVQEDKGEGPSGKRHANTQNTKPTTPKLHEPDAQPRPNADQDTLERPSSSPTRRAVHTDDKPLQAKQLKKRVREPSEVFTSAPPSPTKDPGPSQTRRTPSAPVSTYPRAPPRFVNSFDGQVLVDQKGRVPRAFPLESTEEDEETDLEIVEVKVQWPPVRRQATKQKHASQSDVEVAEHHPFSQPQLPPPLEEYADDDGRRTFKMDRQAVVARFIGDVRVESERGEDVVRNAASPVSSVHKSPASPEPKSLTTTPSEEEAEGERRHPFDVETHIVSTDDVPLAGERREDVVTNGASPAKRTAPPPTEPRTSPTPQPLGSKVPKFPGPRPSVASPFGPEPPVKDARPLQPSSHLPWTRAARHPALARIQRQGKNEREEMHSPTIDFIALTRSSASAQSSRSSHTSVPHPRWSLPGFPRVPWVAEHGASSGSGSAMGSRSQSGSGSGASPLRWRLPVHSEWERDRRASIVFTPSPARSLTTDGAAGSPALTRVALHPTDMDLVCSHGLASFLTHMATNHGLALSVVEEVYGRLGSLVAADEVLKGMREAAQGFGEREIERRLRGRVEETDDEYSPPETSRAALWKRQSMQRAEEEAVEEQLAGEQHDFSRVDLEAQDEVEEASMAEAIVEHLPAQALQRRIGRARFLEEIVKRFV